MTDCGGKARLVKVKVQILITEQKGLGVVSIQNTLHQITESSNIMFLIINATIMCTNISMSCEIFLQKKTIPRTKPCCPKLLIFQSVIRGKARLGRLWSSYKYPDNFWLLDTYRKKNVRVRNHPHPSFLEREVSPESVSPSKIVNWEGYIPSME